MRNYNFLIAYRKRSEEPYRTVFAPLDHAEKGIRFIGFFPSARFFYGCIRHLQGKVAVKYLPKSLQSILFKIDVSRLSKKLRSIETPEKGLCLITNQSLLLFDKDGERIKALKERFPGLKIVFFFTDLVEMDPIRKNMMAHLEKVDANLIISYDRKDAYRYHMLHHPLPYALMERISAEQDDLYDVCFIGKAKDRNEKINEAYDFFTGKGMSCCFYVITEGKTLKETRKGIRYLKHLVSYRKFLELESRSRCILEIIQENSTGYTSRVPEAVFLGKTLISDNTDLRKDQIYDSGKVFVYNDLSDLDTDIIKKSEKIAYEQSYKDIFSHDSFLSFIEENLNLQDQQDI